MARWPVILHRDGSGRRVGTEPKPASVPELARVLRGARTARGLDLDAASAQTGIPIEQLQDLESGTVDRLPDRVAILKALSRYAAFLQLPGEQFVMTLVEHWPSGAAAPAPAVVAHNGQPPGSSAPAPLRAPAHHTRAEDLSTRAIPLTRHDDGVTAVGLPVVGGRHNSTAQVPMVMADTGVTPAVRRRLPSDGLLMVLVRSLVVVAALLIVIGTAWLVINRVHPQWLADLRLPYTSHGVSGPVAPGQSSATTTPRKSTPAPASGARPALHLLSANGSQASFSVSTPLFAVRISAQGGDTWVSASGPLSSHPSFAGIVKSGQSQLVSANHQLTVQIGSTAARVAVQVNSRVIGTYVPPGAPFTMTFTTP